MYATNQPYVKQFEENGILLNPINRIYQNQGRNRKQRRQKETRFMGNGKQFPLTIFGKHRFRRTIQLIIDAAGYKTRVKHYAKLN